MLRITAAQMAAIERILFVDRWAAALAADAELSHHHPAPQPVLGQLFDLAAAHRLDEAAQTKLMVVCLALPDPAGFAARLHALGPTTTAGRDLVVAALLDRIAPDSSFFTTATVE